MDYRDDPSLDARPRLTERRDFIRKAVAGTVVVALGGVFYRIASDDLTRKAQAETRTDGRKRLPPGQKVISRLKPMGGTPGSPSAKDFQLRVHGQVKNPFVLDYAELVKLPKTEQASDVHCVTGWSLLGAEFIGVKVSLLAEKAGVKDTARHVIFEAAHGYTANVRLDEATADQCDRGLSDRRQAVCQKARRPGSRPGARSLLLEERQVAHRYPLCQSR